MINDARQANPDAVITLGADKGFDAAEFIKALEEMDVVAHVAQNTSNRRSAVADEIAATEGYAMSQARRKLIEQGFGWAKQVGQIRRVMVRGLAKVEIALAKGKQLHDKRETTKKRDWQRDKSRIMRDRG